MVTDGTQIKPVKDMKEEIIKKWKDIGLSDGLIEMDENSEFVKLFEPNLTQKLYVKTIPNPDGNESKVSIK
jgi:hypothetical protein